MESHPHECKFCKECKWNLTHMNVLQGVLYSWNLTHMNVNFARSSWNLIVNFARSAESHPHECNEILNARSSVFMESHPHECKLCKEFFIHGIKIHIYEMTVRLSSSFLDNILLKGETQTCYFLFKVKGHIIHPFIFCCSVSLLIVSCCMIINLYIFRQLFIFW